MNASTGSKTMDDNHLAKLVGDELAELRTFVGVLQKEQQALSEGDIDRLMALVADKTSLSSHLGQLAEQRNEMLVAAGFPRDRAGMDGWLTQQTLNAQTTRSNWQNLLTLAAEARALNETNGTLIGTHLQHNQQALNALLTAGNQAALYGPDGQTRPSGGGHLFGAA